MMSSASPATPLPLDRAASGGSSPSAMNALRICAVAERLALHVHNPQQFPPADFYNQCLCLSRGIDYALANGEIPGNAKELPDLMKQLCKRSNDELSQAALMVLMISVKNACIIGWFQPKEAEELFTIADELGKIFCSMGINAGPSSCNSTVSTIMERFYPKLKLGPILVSIEAKPGYGAYTADFHITKSAVQQEKILLLVAQTDNIETSACLISPQQVNFLLNGKGVDRRTNVLMEPGPQMPTIVSGMLKYGTNLLQAIGQFNGHYAILVAYMSLKSLPEHPILQDYAQPAVSLVDSDSDVIEGPSQISLNCPISLARIKTPVKGRSCKHFQCFDFDNFINMNSRKPSWRCPHCNQYVCYEDIRLDRNMVEILKDVGENIVEVIVRDNGSWGSVMENDHDVDKMQNKTQNCEKELAEAHESTCCTSTVPSILDLTNDDDHMVEIMETFETADRKPFSPSLHTPNSTSLDMNFTGVNQNAAAPVEDDFFSGLCLDVFPPLLGQEAEGHDSNPALNSVMNYQVSAPNNLQLQRSYMNSAVNEYGRSPSITSTHIDRTPVAVQALPVQSPASGPQQNSRTNLNSLLPSSSTATTHVPLSKAATADGFNAILSDTERQQHFSRSPMNLPQVSGVNSSVLQHHSAAQNQVPPARISSPSQLPNPNRSSGLLSDLSNPHLQQTLSLRAHPSMRSSNTQWSHMQQGGSIAQSGGAAANGQQTRVNSPAQFGRKSSPVSGQNQTSIAGTVSEQNWRPSARMRGSLSGRECSEEVRQQIIAPTQSVQNSGPQGQQPGQSTRPQGPQAQGSRLQGPQPGLGSRPLAPPPGLGSRPLAPPPGLGSRPLAPPPGLGSRPLAPPPGLGSRPQGPQLVQRPRLQGPQPFRPTGVSPKLDVLIANNRNVNNSSSNT